MGVQAYIQAISNGRGMAKSNRYSVYFQGGTIVPYLIQKGFGGIDAKVRDTISLVGERVLIFCDEVSLPGAQSNTGSIVRHPGANPIYYPTNPIYNDLQLSFMCDAEMQALKFLTTWREKIYKKVGRSYQVNYPDEYECNIVIEKNEPTRSSEVGNSPAKYTLNKAWPYSVDAIPLSYGSSQLVKVTANFYYRDWESTFTPISPIT